MGNIQGWRKCSSLWKRKKEGIDIYDSKKVGEKYEKKVKEKLEKMGYSVERGAGNNGKPDLIVQDGKEIGIEVKACRLFVSNDLEAKVGSFCFHTDSFIDFIDNCEEEGRGHLVVFVIYGPGTEPVIFSSETEWVRDLLENYSKNRVSLTIYQVLRGVLDIKRLISL